MQRIFYVIVLLVTSVVTVAQSKMLTIEDAVIGQWRELYPQSIRNIQWQGDSKSYTFQDYYNLYEQSVTKSDSVVLLTVSGLNTILKSGGVDTVVYFPQIIWANSNEFHFYNNEYWCAVSIKNREVVASVVLPANADNMDLCYDEKLISYTIDNNLYFSGIDNNSIAITHSVDSEIVNGQLVSREEFGINSGIFWSPSANYIAFYRKDVSKVKNYPLVDITAREAEVVSIKYPMAGMSSEHISLGIYNKTLSKTVFIDLQDTITEKYLTNITWGPDEEYIYIQVLNRAQNHMKLNRYLVESGELVNTIFEERHDKYVEPQHPLQFLKNKSDRFIYQSRVDGYNHVYLYNTDGELIKQLTTGEWEVTNIVYLNSTTIYYMSTEVSPIERHLYSLDISSGKKQQLTLEPGVHNVVFNATAKHFIDTYSNTDTPRVISIVKANGQLVREVLRAVNPLVEYSMPNIEIGTIKADDGETDLYYRLIKPIDFDSTKRYPAIVYVYGGPHAQMVTNSWLGGARMWNYYMAQKGYVILTVDNRGSSNRGLEFENVIHRQCGVVEMKDQMKGVDLLKQLGFVNMDKVGVYGWSYGGFMASTMMVNYAEVFKVGVAGGPVMDWKYYEVMYGERYMDTPKENPEGYMYTSLLPRVRDLKGKLLIIQGAIDNVVVMQHSQVFVQECIKNSVPIDYFIYPRSEHNVRGYDRIHLMEKVTKYFDDYLK